MKTSNADGCWQAIRFNLLLAMAALFLGGCVVTSVYPFYTEKDLVFDVSLVGKWMEADATNSPGEYVEIKALGEQGYLATVFARNETNRCELHLFRLRQHLFMDEILNRRSLDWVPTHQLSKVLQTQPTLQTQDMDYDWLRQLLEKHPRAIRHLVLPERPGDTNGRIVLTADTKELQRFLLKHVNDTNAWNQPSEFKRWE